MERVISAAEARVRFGELLRRVAQLKPYINSFRQYMNMSAHQEDEKQRRERVDYFQKYLPAHLEDLSESEVEAIIKMLWASRMWGNKSYLAGKIIADNGMDKLDNTLGGKG